MIFLVKVYVNKMVVNASFFCNLQSAEEFANFEENKEYICEIEAYEYHKTISREFWREPLIEKEIN